MNSRQRAGEGYCRLLPPDRLVSGMTALALVLSAAAPAAADSGTALPPGISATIETGWHSRYINIGARDNLGEGGMFTTELKVKSDTGVFAGAYAIFADSRRYQQTNLYAGISRQWGDFHFGVSYTWLHFYPTPGHSNKDDNELNLAVAWEGLEWATLSADYLTSTDAEKAEGGGGGSMLTLGLYSANAFRAGPVALSPFAAVALDYGFSTPEHDGMNNVKLGLKGAMPLSEDIELNFYVAQSFRGEDIRKHRRTRRGIGDETWGGISLVFGL